MWKEEDEGKCRLNVKAINLNWVREEGKFIGEARRRLAFCSEHQKIHKTRTAAEAY